MSVAVVRPDTELHHVPITFFFHIYFCRFVLNIYFCIFFLNIHLYDCEKFHVRFCTGPVRCDIYLLFFHSAVSSSFYPFNNNISIVKGSTLLTS